MLVRALGFVHGGLVDVALWHPDVFVVVSAAGQGQCSSQL